VFEIINIPACKESVFGFEVSSFPYFEAIPVLQAISFLMLSGEPEE